MSLWGANSFAEYSYNHVYQIGDQPPLPPGFDTTVENCPIGHMLPISIPRDTAFETQYRSGRWNIYLAYGIDSKYVMEGLFIEAIVTPTSPLGLMLRDRNSPEYYTKDVDSMFLASLIIVDPTIIHQIQRPPLFNRQNRYINVPNFKWFMSNPSSAWRFNRAYENLPTLELDLIHYNTTRLDGDSYESDIIRELLSANLPIERYDDYKEAILDETNVLGRNYFYTINLLVGQLSKLHIIPNYIYYLFCHTNAYTEIQTHWLDPLIPITVDPNYVYSNGLVIEYPSVGLFILDDQFPLSSLGLYTMSVEEMFSETCLNWLFAQKDVMYSDGTRDDHPSFWVNILAAIPEFAAAKTTYESADIYFVKHGDSTFYLSSNLRPTFAEFIRQDINLTIPINVRLLSKVDQRGEEDPDETEDEFAVGLSSLKDALIFLYGHNAVSIRASATPNLQIFQYIRKLANDACNILNPIKHVLDDPGLRNHKTTLFGTRYDTATIGFDTYDNIIITYPGNVDPNEDSTLLSIRPGSMKAETTRRTLMTGGNNFSSGFIGDWDRYPGLSEAYTIDLQTNPHPDWNTEVEPEAMLDFANLVNTTHPISFRRGWYTYFILRTFYTGPFTISYSSHSSFIPDLTYHITDAITEHNVTVSRSESTFDFIFNIPPNPPQYDNGAEIVLDAGHLLWLVGDPNYKLYLSPHVHKSVVVGEILKLTTPILETDVVNLRNYAGPLVNSAVNINVQLTSFSMTLFNIFKQRLIVGYDNTYVQQGIWNHRYSIGRGFGYDQQLTATTAELFQQLTRALLFNDPRALSWCRTELSDFPTDVSEWREWWIPDNDVEHWRLRLQNINIKTADHITDLQHRQNPLQQPSLQPLITILRSQFDLLLDGQRLTFDGYVTFVDEAKPATFELLFELCVNRARGLAEWNIHNPLDPTWVLLDMGAQLHKHIIIPPDPPSIDLTPVTCGHLYYVWLGCIFVGRYDLAEIIFGPMVNWVAFTYGMGGGAGSGDPYTPYNEGAWIYNYNGVVNRYSSRGVYFNYLNYPPDYKQLLELFGEPRLCKAFVVEWDVTNSPWLSIRETIPLDKWTAVGIYENEFPQIPDIVREHPIPDRFVDNGELLNWFRGIADGTLLNRMQEYLIQRFVQGKGFWTETNILYPPDFAPINLFELVEFVRDSYPPVATYYDRIDPELLNVPSINSVVTALSGITHKLTDYEILIDLYASIRKESLPPSQSFIDFVNEKRRKTYTQLAIIAGASTLLIPPLFYMYEKRRSEFKTFRSQVLDSEWKEYS
jgi:hypothetical protein